MKKRKNWMIKEEEILDDLMALVNLTTPEKELLADLQEPAQMIAPVLSEAFYQRVLSHPLTAEYVDGQLEDRKRTLSDWFIQLFSGEYGPEYIRSRLKIGRVHVNIGLPIRYPLAMMDVLDEFGSKVTAQSADPEQATNAFRKILAIDIAIFNQAYEDTQLARLTKATGNELLARRMLTQG